VPAIGFRLRTYAVFILAAVLVCCGAGALLVEREWRRTVHEIWRGEDGGPLALPAPDEAGRSRSPWRLAPLGDRWWVMDGAAAYSTAPPGQHPNDLLPVHPPPGETWKGATALCSLPTASGHELLLYRPEAGQLYRIRLPDEPGDSSGSPEVLARRPALDLAVAARELTLPGIELARPEEVDIAFTRMETWAGGAVLLAMEAVWDEAVVNALFCLGSAPAGSGEVESDSYAAAEPEVLYAAALTGEAGWSHSDTPLGVVDQLTDACPGPEDGLILVLSPAGGPFLWRVGLFDQHGHLKREWRWESPSMAPPRLLGPAPAGGVWLAYRLPIQKGEAVTGYSEEWRVVLLPPGGDPLEVWDIPWPAGCTGGPAFSCAPDGRLGVLFPEEEASLVLAEIKIRPAWRLRR